VDEAQSPRFLTAGGEMDALIRAHDWSTTLGPPENWPEALRHALRLILPNAHPMLIWWGPDLIQLYNDAHRLCMQPDRHPAALGQKARAFWREFDEAIAPQIDHIMSGRGATWGRHHPVRVKRGDRFEHEYWTYSYNPIAEPSAPHGVGGVLLMCRETTEDYVAARREASQLALEDRLRDLTNPRAVMTAAAEWLGQSLSADRAGYLEIDATGEIAIVESDWCAPGTPSLSGSRRIDDLGPALAAALRAGETVAFDDVLDEALAKGPEIAAAFAGISSRAAIIVPLIKGGRFAAALFAHQRGPRHWTSEDKILVQDVAERTWAAVERARAEAALRESEARLKALNESLEREVARRTGDLDRFWRLSSDLMAVVQFDAVIVAVNPAWTAVLGWSESELVGRKLFDFIHPDDAPASRSRPSNLPVGTTTWRFDNRYRRRDGEWRWISWTAVPADGLVNAVGRDMTEEKAKTDALERSEARLRSVFETSYQFQGLLTADGAVVDANPVSLAAIQTGIAELVGRPYWETPWFSATPGMPEQIRAAIAVAAGGGSVRQELALNLPTGQRVFDFSLRPVVNSAGAVIGVVPEAMETTERRAAEEQLRQSQKMEAVGQLTGGLAHDFNNLLAGIMGSLELLRSRVEQGRVNDLQRFISGAQGAATRAAALTHRLLAFSRRQTLDPKSTDANRLIMEMADLIQRTVGPAIAFETRLSPEPWGTLCDPNQLENALLNLCINARDAMPDGGRLTIATAKATLDERAAREMDVAAGDYVVMSVEDTGAGMPPDVLARAFDPFFTTKPIGMGTGLGLSMIYGFARQSGGHVQLFSTPGQGTQARLYLPRHDQKPAGHAARGELSAAPRADHGETVLVVDDEALVRALVSEVLAEFGYTAIEAADAAAGLKVLRSDAAIDLLISDVGLPGGMNGRQLADAARQTRPDLKVLFITGYADEAVMGKGQLAQGMHLITKPFAMETMATRIKAIIGGA
jgi:PAS domain S-box-containing protein